MFTSYIIGARLPTSIVGYISQEDPRCQFGPPQAGHDQERTIHVFFFKMIVLVIRKPPKTCNTGGALHSVWPKITFRFCFAVLS